MADYDPSIPGANDILSQSQSDIQNNFSELNTIFDVDHQTWNSDPSGNRGFHKQITMPAGLGAAPTPISTQGILYPLADTKDTSLRTQLYFKNQSNTIQITNRFKSATTDGYVMIPGNISSPAIIQMWDIQTKTLSGGQSYFTINFPTISNYNYSGGQTYGFPNNIFAINFQIVSNSTSKNIFVYLDSSSGTPVTKEKYTVNIRSSTSNDTVTFYMTAIGN